MIAPPTPPNTAPIIAPLAVLPVAFPITAPTTAPPPAPITAPFCDLVAVLQPEKIKPAYAITNADCLKVFIVQMFTAIIQTLYHSTVNTQYGYLQFCKGL